MLSALLKVAKILQCTNKAITFGSSRAIRSVVIFVVSTPFVIIGIIITATSSLPSLAKHTIDSTGIEDILSFSADGAGEGFAGGGMGSTLMSQY